MAARALAALSAAALLVASGCGPDTATGTARGVDGPARAVVGASTEPGAGWAALPAPGAAAGRNLVLLTLDTTRADRLGAYGHAGAETPHLDRLAAGGVRFADAVTAVPMTLPAHATLFTGRYPPGHGVRANGERGLAAEADTLAEAFAAAGHRTAAFVSSFVLDPRFGLDQGFATYDASLAPSAAAAFVAENERDARTVTDAALAWLADLPAGDDKPFFLWVHYFDPHDPYAPPPPFAERFRGRPYDGEIAYMDAQIGRLLAALEARGALAESVVVAVGDHGESLGEHHERYHSRTLYEAAVRVPLIVAAPGLIPADGAPSTPAVAGGATVTLADLYPTLLDLFDLRQQTRRRDAELDGVSLLRVAPGALARRPVYLETLATYLDNGWAPLFAARRHGEKYIEAPRPELYDLTTDPDESDNLLAGDDADGEHAETVALLARFIEGSRSEAGEAGEAGEGGALAAAMRAAADAEPDAETRARLESLGYLTAGGGREVDAGPPPDPKDMLPLLDLLLAGRDHLAAGRLAEAERAARSILAEAPRDRSALQLLAEVYAVGGRPADAERVLVRLLDIRPGVEALALLAQVVMQQGRFDDARELLDQAAALDPRHGAVAIARGDLELVQGRPAAAIEHYRRAERLDPHRVAGLARARVRMAAALVGE